MPSARAQDMAAQLAALGLTYDGQQLLPADYGAPEPEPQTTVYQEPIYAAAPSLGRLEDSAGWQGLMAELDRQGAIYRTEAARQQGLIGGERDRLMTELGQRGELEREGVANSMEARGLYRSGETEQGIARQRQNELSRGSAITAGAAGRISDVEGQLALQNAEIERRRAEARADYLSRGFTT